MLPVRLVPEATGNALVHLGKASSAWQQKSRPINRIPMEWHVQYRSEGVEHVIMHPTPEMAIETACRLIDEGGDVFGIGTLSDSIDRKQISRIYDMWVRMELPFRRRPLRSAL
jgi:hypothetical protein